MTTEGEPRGAMGVSPDEPGSVVTTSQVTAMDLGESWRDMRSPRSALDVSTLLDRGGTPDKSLADAVTFGQAAADSTTPVASHDAFEPSAEFEPTSELFAAPLDGHPPAAGLGDLDGDSLDAWPAERAAYSSSALPECGAADEMTDHAGADAQDAANEATEASAGVCLPEAPLRNAPRFEETSSGDRPRSSEFIVDDSAYSSYETIDDGGLFQPDDMQATGGRYAQEAATEQTAPEQTAPERTAPEQAVPEQAAPEQAATLPVAIEQAATLEALSRGAAEVLAPTHPDDPSEGPHYGGTARSEATSSSRDGDAAAESAAAATSTQVADAGSAVGRAARGADAGSTAHVVATLEMVARQVRSGEIVASADPGAPPAAVLASVLAALLSTRT